MEMETVLNSLWTSGWPGLVHGNTTKFNSHVIIRAMERTLNASAQSNSPSVSVLGSPDGLASWGG